MAAPAPARAQSTCIGDCNNSQSVTINEIIECVDIALGTAQLPTCPPCSANGISVQVTDLISAVNNALNGCGSPGTPTLTPTGSTPTATKTPIVSTCPLQPGAYTVTSQNGGVLKVATFSAFRFPPFGDIVADLSAGDANCIHSAVVPFPGGFTSPVFCVPALGATTLVTQTSCGIGQFHSKGGGDYTVTELGDTSFTSSGSEAACAIHQATCPGPGPAPDSSILVRVAVGDGTADTCADGGTINSMVSIPVATITWVENAPPPGECPAVDGTYDKDKGDLLLAKFPQTLDFTTDTTIAKFQDLDGDGCLKSGLGPIAYAGAGPSGANSFCLGPQNPSACCTDVNKGSCTGPQGTCMDLSKLNATLKECKKGDTNGNHTVCTADGDCGSNGPCVIGECYKDAAVHCSVDGDCKECQGTAGTANPTFCATDNDCPTGVKPCLDVSPCRQLGVVAATTVASGTIGTSGGPTYDLLFETVLPNAVTGPKASLGATCAMPPLINFSGTVDRCIVAP